MSREVSRFKALIDVVIEKVSKGVHNKISSMDRGGIKELSKGQELSRSIHLAIKRCQDCDKKQLKSSIDKPGIERCRDCLKIVFQEEKNTDMNAIKHATQPMIQTTF